MLQKLKQEVFWANISLVREHLVILTWGNVSGIDRKKGLVVIKPSGVDYGSMRSDQMVVVDLMGKVVEGELKPSSDLPSHLLLYNAFPEIGSVVHTHSMWATVWAQAGKSIPPLGTTHADYFSGEIPCTRMLTRQETRTEYEKNTGKVIVESFTSSKLSPEEIPGVLVRNHGPFVWGETPSEAVEHAVILEQIAKMAYYTLALNPKASLPEYVMKKHYLRKHGPEAYYGQS